MFFLNDRFLNSKINLLSLFLFILNSPLSLAQKQTDPPQVKYLIQQLPQAFLNLPNEIIYQITHDLNLDKWTSMRKNQEIINLLKSSSHKNLPTTNNTFPFENYDEDFEGIVSRDYGVCSGFATLQRNFNILLHFDPYNESHQLIPQSVKGKISFYQSLLQNAADGFPVIIPGFNNLYEMMLDKELQQFTKKLIVKKWAQNNASLQGVDQFLNSKKQLPQKKFKKLFDELKERLDIGYNPLIYTSFPSTEEIKFNIHVLQAVKISDYDSNNNTFNLWVWDDGVVKEFFGPFAASKLLKVISFRQDGQILWLEDESYLNLPLDSLEDPKILNLKTKLLIDKTLWIDLLPNDDLEMSKIMFRKYYWCQLTEEGKKFCPSL